MTTLLETLRFVNLFSGALVAGGLVMILMVVVPAKRSFPHDLSVKVHLAMLHDAPDVYMKPAGIISFLTGAALLFLPRGMGAAYIAAMVIGLLGTVGVVITSRYHNVRTNLVMSKWESIPPNYPEVRERWDNVHRVRTACGVTAFVGYLLASLLR
jgi:hypothetical protein